MPDMNKFVGYCYIYPYLKKKEYEQAVADERFDGRILRDSMEYKARAEQRLNTLQNQQSQLNTVLPDLHLIQRGLTQILKPLQGGINLFQAMLASMMPKAPQSNEHMPKVPMGQRMEKALSQVLSFFFGFKKENDKTEERETREQEDLLDFGIFSKLTVQEASNDGLGSGAGK